jgi:hypothetical protein
MNAEQQKGTSHHGGRGHACASRIIYTGSAHVDDAAQNHTKSNYLRNPPASDIFNEEVCNLLKRKIKATVSHLDALSIDFDYDGSVTEADACEILEKISALHRRALAAAAHTPNPEARRRSGSSPPTSKKPSIGLNLTSFNRTCCGLWMTWLGSSRPPSTKAV